MVRPMIARILGVVGRAMIAAGVLLLLFAAYQLWGTGFRTDRAQANLTSDFDQQLARVANNQAPIARSPAVPDDPVAGLSDPATTRTPRSTTTRAPGDTSPGTSPSGPGDENDPNLAEPADFRYAKGDAIGRITIPKIGADFTVLEGVDLPLLSEGPGHFPGTSLPGQPGNAALAGHRVTYKAPFNRIDELAPGDQIRITTAQGTFTYEVMAQDGGLGYFIVDPSNTSIIEDKGDNRLTLMACHPKYDLKQRIVVSAKLIGTPADTSLKGAADRPTLPNADGSDFTGGGEGVLLGNDPAARLPALLLSLAALAVWLVAWLVARRIDGRRHWLVYLAASPVFFVILWFAFDYINRSLPGAY
jgi:sortase A